MSNSSATQYKKVLSIYDLILSNIGHIVGAGGFVLIGGNRRLTKNNIDSPSPQKLFNYLIQSKETENNVKILTDLFKYLENKQTKIILYTYDSILFDFSKNDSKQCLIDIKLIIEKNGFKTKFQYGKNYGFKD